MTRAAVAAVVLVLSFYGSVQMFYVTWPLVVFIPLYIAVNCIVGLSTVYLLSALAEHKRWFQ
jgi:hypothetical protein